MPPEKQQYKTKLKDPTAASEAARKPHGGAKDRRTSKNQRHTSKDLGGMV